jgi:hypothetical protein
LDSIPAGGGLAWACLSDTHNEVRLAVDPLSGEFPITIYAGKRKSVRLGCKKSRHPT